MYDRGTGRHTGGPYTHAPVERRIFGLENEYGVTCTLRGQRRLSPDEVARYLFRRVVSWGRSSNVFLENGARLYLDVGSHPEYATPECDSIHDLVVHDKAGERILEGLVQSAEQRLREEGIRGEVFLFKNNTDSAGNSYGCHENYLVEREGDFSKFTDVLIPFLVTRQIYAGAGKVLQTARGAMYCIAQRAEHIWEGVSSATTRSRPIINTRDEPHADAERFRRLHVIVGDSNMSEYATFLKVGATSIILRMLEEDGAPWRDLTLENPIRAIREISHDITCRRRVRLANGRELSAVEIQAEYLNRALRFAKRRGLPPLEQQALEMWEHVMTHLEDDPLKLRTEVDWVIKYHLIEAYRTRGDLPLTHPRVSLLDLAYHDVTRSRSLYYLLERRGQVDRIVTDDEITEAVNTPPQSTRARLRGAFIKRAKERKRDYTVDWVHLKLNDQAQRTVLVQGPVQVARRARRTVDRLARSATGLDAVVSRRGRSREIARERAPGCSASLVDLGAGAGAGVRADAAHRDRLRSATGSSSTRPPSSSGSAPAGGTSCTGTWSATDVAGPEDPGMCMKAAVHVSLQVDVGATRSRADGARSAGCRSWSRGVALAGRRRSRSRSSSARPDARLVYVMTDGGALPIAISDLVLRAARPRPARRDDHVRARVRRRLRSGVGAGRARGRASRRRAPTRSSSRWGRAAWGPRPGSASAASRSGRCSTPSPALDGVRDRGAAGRRSPIRGSGTAASRTTASRRSRSRRRAGCTSRCRRVGGDEEAGSAPISRGAGIDDRHDVVDVAPVGIVALLERTDLHVESMGRPAADDPVSVRMPRPPRAPSPRDARRLA